MSAHRARRRSRYTVNFVDGSKEVVLGYDAEEVRAWRSATKEVASVVKGDYRAKVNAEVGDGFRIMQRALEAAKIELGLDFPVKIRFNSRMGSTRGNYRFKGTHHDIMIKSYLSPEQASSTLWHELTHAMQAERSGGTRAEWYKVSNDQKRYTYRNRPIELEANAMSRKMAGVPLCKAR